MKTTEWYPAAIAPTRNGFYEVRCTKSTAWGEFTRVKWSDGKWRGGDIRIVKLCDEWRGLTEPQE